MADQSIPTYPPPDKRRRPAHPREPAAAARSRTAVEPCIAAAVAQVDPTRITGWLEDLVAFPTRHTLSTHNVEAAEWLRGQFQTLGYTDVVFHDFTHSGVTRHSVICTKPGAVDPSQHLIICAHYDSRMSNLSDSTSAAPGADDNGSGVTALLEIARVLFAIDTTYSVRFAAFSGEEQGLIGSTAYASFANSTGMQIPLLINLDMIGHPEDPLNPSVVVERDMGNDVATNDAPSQAFATQMTQAAADYTTIKTSLGPIYSSDYMPFEHYGYVCIGVFDGADTAPFYHTSNDTLDKVDLGFCTEAIRMVLATVLTVAGQH
jgi:bacterial leucyl aminopeptidase